MNRSLQKKSAFIFKSVMWSLLFYFILMLLFNWDDVATRIKGQGAMTNAASTESYHQAVDANAPEPSPLSGESSLPGNIYMFVQIVSGI